MPAPDQPTRRAGWDDHRHQSAGPQFAAHAVGATCSPRNDGGGNAAPLERRLEAPRALPIRPARWRRLPATVSPGHAGSMRPARSSVEPCHRHRASPAHWSVSAARRKVAARGAPGAAEIIHREQQVGRPLRFEESLDLARGRAQPPFVAVQEVCLRIHRSRERRTPAAHRSRARLPDAAPSRKTPRCGLRAACRPLARRRPAQRDLTARRNRPAARAAQRRDRRVGVRICRRQFWYAWVASDANVMRTCRSALGTTR